MRDESAVTEVLSCIGESPRIYHRGYDLHCSDRTDTIDLSLVADQRVTPGHIGDTSLILLFAAPIEVDVLLEHFPNKGGGLPLVAVPQCQGPLLVQGANSGTDNILIRADQCSEFVHSIVAVVDLLEKACPQQFAELSRVDLIRLGPCHNNLL